METREVIVDWVAESGLDRDDRPVDDWTAGEDLDFAVREPRRRRGAELAKPEPEPGAEPASAPEPGGFDDLDAELQALTSEHEVPASTPRAPGARRTVAITGRPEALRDVPRLREVERRRATRRPADRVASRPDRIAMWAVVLGFVLILIASVTTP